MKHLMIAGLMVALSACSTSLKVSSTNISSPPSEQAPRNDAPHAVKNKKIATAILPFANRTGDISLDSLSDVLAEAGMLELVDHPRLAIVERSRLDEILNELKIQKRSELNPLTAMRIGKLIGAQMMVFGTYAKLQGKELLTVRVVNVETGRILGGNSSQHEDNLGLAALARRVTRKALDAAIREDFESPESEAQPEASQPHSRRKRNVDGLAVIIGVSEYRNSDIPKAEFALSDAQAMKRHLVAHQGFKEEDIIDLRNPTKADLESVFGDAANAKGRLHRFIGKRDPKAVDLFVYYSGHGAPSLNSRSAYIAPSDADPNFIEMTGYARDVLLGNLAKLGARTTTVVLESCFSGNYAEGTLLRNASPLVISVNPPKSPPEIDLLASSSGAEISSWYPEKRRSLYTYFLLKTLDSAQPGAMTFKILNEKVERNVSDLAARKYNRVQTPQFSGSPDRSIFAD